MKHRSGYKSSEFWFTLVSFLFSGLYLIGVIGDSSYKDELIRDVSHAVESVILIVGQVVIVYNYIKSREHVKEAELKVEEVIEKPVRKPRTPKTPKIEEKTNEPKPRKSKPDSKSTNKPRTSAPRSRKTDKQD
jgi:hypothetical protein